MIFNIFSPKNYCIKTANQVDIKCRGFHLGSSKSKDIVNEDVYKEFVNTLLLEEEAERKVVPQFKISFFKAKSSLFSHYQLKSFCSHVFTKRVLLKPENERLISQSLPFGYSEKMLKKVLEENKT